MDAGIKPHVVAALDEAKERVLLAEQRGGAPFHMVAVVCDAMRAHPDDAPLQLHCCQALAGAGEAEMLPRDAEGAAAVIDAVLTALDVHAADSVLVSSGLKALSTLAEPPRAVEKLCATASRIVRAAVGALRTHKRNAEVQLQGCMLLSSLLTEGGEDAVGQLVSEALVDSGGLVTVVGALRARVHAYGMQISVCGVLAFLIGESAVASAIAAGALEVIVAVMEAHGDAFRVLELCYLALNTLLSTTCNEQTADLAAAAGVLSAVAAALRAPASNASLRKDYCVLLSTVVAEMSSGGELIIASDVVSALLATLKQHAADVNVIEAACNALRSLILLDDCVLQQVANSGGSEAMLALLARPALDRSILPSIVDVLLLLCEIDAVATRAVTLGGIEALVAVMRKHADASNDMLLEGCCLTLDYMVGINTGVNASRAYRAGALPFVKACKLRHADDEGMCQSLLDALQQSVANADAVMAALLAEEDAERPARRTTSAAAKGKGKGKSKSKKKGGKGGAAASSSRARSRSRSRSVSPDAPPLEEAGDGAAASGDATPDAVHADAAAAEAQAQAHQPAAANDDAGGAGPSGSGAGCSAASPPPPAAPRPRGGAPRAYCPPMGPAGVPAAFPPPPPRLPPFQQPCASQQPAAAALLPLPAYLAGLVLNAPPPPQPAPLPAPAAPLPAPPAVAAEPPPPPPPVMKECCVCFLNVEVNSLHLLVPCCHRCVCGDCAAALMVLAPPAPRLCPKCRKPVSGASLVFDE
jgi:hypothetical protein